MNEMASYIKTEEVDIETFVIDQNFSTNLHDRADLLLHQTAYISDPISSQFECKDEPLQHDFQGNNKWS